MSLSESLVVGIDFDNTIVSYDGVFYTAALEKNLIPEACGTGKDDVKSFLIDAGREHEWTELQGYVYGKRMMDAAPFPGVGDFFGFLRDNGIEYFIISHKTRFPYAGPKYDLHAAAREWLENSGFAGFPIPPERIFFRERKEEKIACIRERACTHFIDDLPEILLHPDFPVGTKKMLFFPAGTATEDKSIEVFRNWCDIREYFTELRNG